MIVSFLCIVLCLNKALPLQVLEPASSQLESSNFLSPRLLDDVPHTSLRATGGKFALTLNLTAPINTQMQGDSTIDACNADIISRLGSIPSRFHSNFALLVPFGLCSVEEQARNAQRAGAAILVLGGDKFPGFTFIRYDERDRSDISIGVVQLSKSDLTTIQELVWKTQNFTIPVFISSDDENPWKVTSNLKVPKKIQSSFLAFLSFACCWQAFFKLRHFYILSKGFKLSIPQVALTVEGLAQFMNGLYVVLDVLSQLHYTSWRVLSVIATSPSFAVTILVIFYFRDLTAQTGMKAGVSFIQSKSSKIVLIFCTVALVLLDLTTSFLTAFRVADTRFLDMITGLVYSMASIAIGIAFLKAGNKLVNQINSSNKGSKGKKEGAYRIARSVQFTAFFILLRVLGTIAVVSPIWSSPWGRYFIWWWIATCGLLSTWFKIGMFQVPNKNSNKVQNASHHSPRQSKNLSRVSKSGKYQVLSEGSENKAPTNESPMQSRISPVQVKPSNISG